MRTCLGRKVKDRVDVTGRHSGCRCRSCCHRLERGELGWVIAVPELQAVEDASLLSRGIAVGLGRIPSVSQIDPRRFDVLGRLVSPRGLLLRVWSGNNLDHDGSSAWTLEILSCGCVMAVASSLVDIRLAEVAAHVGELVGPETMSAGSERDVAQSA